MGVQRLLDEIGSLVDILRSGDLDESGVIPWASPVISFGSPINAKLATLGLNPSNLEFQGRGGVPLNPPLNRFETLYSLQAVNWGAVGDSDIDRIWKACENYFDRNPYGRWFNRLERLLVDTSASYYSKLAHSACHLDLSPFATERKWSALTSSQRAALLNAGTSALVRTIRASDIRVLVLNGSSVIREFNRLGIGGSISSAIVPEWSLQGGKVAGISYFGRLSELMGIKLDRELVVLGYNHNIQSTFGVTSRVTASIANWIAEKTAEALA